MPLTKYPGPDHEGEKLSRIPAAPTLARLPAHPWLRVILAVAVVLGLLGGAPLPVAHAAALVVGSTADTTANDGACTLREAILNANDDTSWPWRDCVRGSSADTITFNQGLGPITLIRDLPEITHDLTINGLKGLTGRQIISGANTYRVFNLAPSQLLFRLSYVEVTNGAAVSTDDDGGGLYVANSAQASVAHSRFTNNTTSGNGGAIYNNGILTVTASAFISNTASDGGAIYSNSSTSLSVTDSTFTDNGASGSGSRGGAIVGFADPMTLDGNTFTHNHTEGSGGAVSGTARITQSDFLGNTADSGGAISGGGTISAATFTGNSAVSGGGAIAANTNPLTVTYSTFIANTGSSGGALHASNAIVMISSSDFLSNTASGGTGGALLLRGNSVMTLANSALAGNSASQGGALGTQSAGSGQSPQLMVSTCTFSDNTAANQGGVIYHSSGTIELTQSTFTHNHTTGGIGWGGAIANYAALTVMGCQFSLNSSEAGGAIFNGRTATVTASVLTRNEAVQDGGALYNGADHVLVVAASLLTLNEAARGGALNNAGMFTVTNSTLANNSATLNGSALFASGGAMAVFHSTFASNGGPEALYRQAGTLTLANSIVAHSAAANCAGTLSDGGYNLQFGGNVVNACGASVETADPLLGALANNGGATQTMALLAGSAALNRIPGAGGCGVGVTVDQRGGLRPGAGGLCDIGAYELNFPVFLPVVIQ